MLMTPQEKLDLAITNFDPLLDGLARLIEAVAHPDVNAIPPGDGWRHSGQTLMVKLYHHLRSMRTLAAGVSIGLILKDDNDAIYFDHGSMAALGRAALEAYANFHFIFGGISFQEQLFRWRIWKIHGLTSLLKLNGFAEPDPRVEAVRERDGLSVPILRDQIRDDPLFQLLAKDEQGQALKATKSRMGRGLPGIVASGGLPKKYAEDMYNHYSEYAHSGAVSTFQIYDAMRDGSHPALASLTIGFSVILLAQAIVGYATENRAAHAALYADGELMNQLSRCQNFISQTLFPSYGEIVPTV